MTCELSYDNGGKIICFLLNKECPFANNYDCEDNIRYKLTMVQRDARLKQINKLEQKAQEQR